MQLQQNLRSCTTVAAGQSTITVASAVLHLSKAGNVVLHLEEVGVQLSGDDLSGANGADVGGVGEPARGKVLACT